MAEVRSGSFRTYGYSDPGYTDHYVFSWSLTSQSIVDNTSTISWSVKGDGATNSAYWTYVQEKYVTVNGVTQTNATKVATYNGTVAFSGTTVIKHSNNGKGSFSASCGGAFYSYGSYNSTGSGAWDLPTIARASTVSGVSGSLIGGKTIVTIKRAADNFTHQLWYKVGNSDWYDLGKGYGTSAEFTIALETAKQFPNSTKGNMQICVRTFNGSTQIGDDYYYNVEVGVPPYDLTGSLTVTGNNLLRSFYVQGESTATVNVSATTQHGAEIKNISATVDNKTYSGSKFTTSPLSSGNQTISVTITDTRGKTLTLSPYTLTVYPYNIPTITEFSLERQADGTTVIATVKGSFAPVNNRNANEVAISLGTQLIGFAKPNEYTFDTTETFTNVPTDTTLVGKLTLTDAYTSVSKETVLPTVAVTMDFYKDGTGIAMGKVAEMPNTLEVAWKIKNHSVPTLLGGTGTFIENNSNLGDEKFLIPGNYLCSSNNGAATLINCPSKIAFKMCVYNCLDVVTDAYTAMWMYLIREITNIDGNSWVQFIRKEGGSWNISNWKQVLNSEICTDYVVDQGTSGIWTYRKWNSGIAECWGIYTMTSPCTAAWGSLYYSNNLCPRINYPFTFTSRPQETVFCRGDSVSAWAYPEGGGIGMNTTTQTGQYGFLRPTTMTEAQVRYEFTVIGKWK